MRAKPVLSSLRRLRWEVAAVAVILTVAWLLRSYQITSLPSGLHGDEAISGLVAQRILKEGYIGPYSTSAWGQPAGPMYLTAISVWLLGDTILAVRIISALLGTVTVLALYLVLRRNYSVSTALVGSLLFAVMSWHIHYTRIGLPLASWPLFVILAGGALAEAVRRKDAHWWAIAGVATGAGIYIYNAHPLFLLILAAFSALYFVGNVAVHYVRHKKLAPRKDLIRVGTMAVAIGITSLPMVQYATDESNKYSSHFDKVSVLGTTQWTSLDSTTERAAFIAGRYGQYWESVCCSFRPDGTDGIGVVPVVPLAMLLLAGIGAILGLLSRRPLAYFGLFVVLLMPFAPVFTHADGGMRRTFAIAPFVAMFAALPIAAILGLANVRGVRLNFAARTGLAALLVLVVGYQNLTNYFVKFAESGRQRWVFAQELTDAAKFMSQLPADSHVYFYSDRWSVRYETVRFLAPNVRAEDRSERFGKPGLDVDPSKGTPVFVFLGKYKPMVEEARRRYPQGVTALGNSAEITWRSTTGGPTFVAYVPGSDSIPTSTSRPLR